MNRFEALTHTRFCAHPISKFISYKLYKNSLIQILCLQIHIYVLYLFLFKTSFDKNIFPLKILFENWFLAWAGRPPESTVPLTGVAGRPPGSTVVLADARISVHVSRSTVTVDRDEPDCKSLLSVCLGRLGRSTVACNGHFLCTSGRPGRSTGLAVWTVTASFWTGLIFVLFSLKCV